MLCKGFAAELRVLLSSAAAAAAAAVSPLPICEPCGERSAVLYVIPIQIQPAVQGRSLNTTGAEHRNAESCELGQALNSFTCMWKVWGGAGG